MLIFISYINISSTNGIIVAILLLYDICYRFDSDVTQAIKLKRYYFKTSKYN